MYINVIPLDASLGNRPLTYSVGDIFRQEIQTGMLISIPYGKKHIEWVVSEILPLPLEETDTSVRPIESLLSPVSILAPYQLQTLERIAKKYFLPIHRVASFFLPIPTRKRLKKQSYSIHPHAPQTPHLPSGIHIIQDDIVRTSHINALTQEKTVIIVPDDILLHQMHSAYTDKDTLVLYHESSGVKKAQAWIDIVNGKYQRIVWTRRLLYYNLWAYTNIVYVEDNFQREYFHFPIRILYTDILAHIEGSGAFSLQILTSIPRLSTLATFRHLPLHHISLSCQKNPTSTSHE